MATTSIDRPDRRPETPPAAPRAARRPAGVAKRVIDVLLAAAGLVLVAPLLAVVALAVVCDSRGPVLFRQSRVGRDGRSFRLAKFRTMIDGADAMTDGLAATSRDADWLLLDRDPRVTRVGRVLRRMSLDELPQLWHVLRGEMSLVGPRPLSERDAERVPAWAAVRHRVRPGITGPWQVSGRTRLSFREMLELDVAYARSHSMRGDLVLLLRTIPAVLTARGAN